MMTDIQLANTLSLVIVLGLCSLIVFKILPSYRVDALRQKLFAIRDQMFDYAAEGNIEFDAPAYVLLRRHMNGLIRYGHHLTVPSMLMTALMYSKSPSGQPSWGKQWDAALRKVRDAEVRSRLQAFHDEEISIAVRHLVFGSPVLWLAIAAASTGLVFHGAALGTRQLLVDASYKVLKGPLDRRYIEAAAIAA